MKNYKIDRVRGIVYRYDMMFRDYLFYSMLGALTEQELEDIRLEDLR